MASPSFNEDYLIIRVNQHDQPASTIPHYENAATYISVSISICRGMLRTTKAKEAFKEFAETFHSDLPETTAEEYTQMFINKILDRFPPIFVDYSMLNPDLIACHFRRKWVGYLEAFDTRKQGIAINGPKVHAMCGTGVAAEGSVNPDSDEQQRFRVYLFTFAKSMLHEIGHMFVTFLTHGETTTPPHISGKVAGYEGKRGEAGERLENLIFGGRVVVMAKPDDREDLAGICYIVKPRSTHKIEQKTIDEIIKYQFNFPIAHAESKIAHSARTLGFHLLPCYPLGDPFEKPDVQRLLNAYEENQIE